MEKILVNIYLSFRLILRIMFFPVLSLVALLYLDLASEFDRRVYKKVLKDWLLNK